MKKKSVSVIMSVMMLFSAISFAGCQQDETALLRAQVDGLQAKLDEKIETIEELKTLIEKQTERIEELEEINQEILDDIYEWAPSGEFYSLELAYERGWIAKEDLLSIAYYHGDEEENKALMGENYTPLPKIPGYLDEKTETEIKEKLIKNKREEATNVVVKGGEITGYYGYYKGFMAIEICKEYDCYPAVVKEVTVGGVLFIYPFYPCHIYLWKV